MTSTKERSPLKSMASASHEGKSILTNRLIIVGIVLSLCYWVIESFADTLVQDASFAARLLTLEDPNELWMRLTIVTLIIAFSAYTQVLANGLRKAHQTHLLMGSIVQTATDAIITVYADGLIRSFNPAAERIFGYTSREIIGQPIEKLVPECFGPEYEAQYEADYLRYPRGYATHGGETGPAEFVGLRKNGEAFPIELSTGEIMEEDHVLFTCIIRDITGREKARRELDRSVSTLHTILESTADGILALDRKNNILNFNHKFAEMWGIPESLLTTRDNDLVRKSVLGLLVDPEGFEAEIRTFQEHPEKEAHATLRLKDERIFERYMQPQLIGDEVVGRVLSFRDVTSQRRAEEKIRELNRTLEQRVEKRTAQLEATLAEVEDSEALLRDSLDRYGLVVDGANVGIWDLDIVTRELYLNNRFCEILDLSTSDFVPTTESVAALVHPEDLNRAQDEFRRHLEYGGEYQLQLRLRNSSGEYRDCIVRAKAQRDSGGKPYRVTGIVLDVTEHRKTEKRLQEAELRYRTLVEQIPAITYIKELAENGKTLAYMSPQYEAMLGYSVKERIHNPDQWLKIVHPDDRDRILAEDSLTDKTLEPFKAEYRVIASGGETLWLQDEAMIVRGERGEPLYWQGVQFDITEQKRSEEALKHSEELYRSVVEQAAENILLVDARTKRILEANTAFYHSLGYTPEEVQEMNLYDLVAHDEESIDENVRRVLEEGCRFLGERQYRHKDGSLVDVEVSVSTIRHGDRNTLCTVAHDVTARRRAEDGLRQSLGNLLALYEVGQVLASTLTVSEITQRLRGLVERVAGVEAIVVGLLDENQQLNTIYRSSPEKLLNRIRTGTGSRAVQRVALKRLALKTHEPQLFEIENASSEPGDRLGMFLPLLAGDRLIGLIEAHGNSRLLKVTPKHILGNLANQIASALDRARLYEELAEREHRLQGLVGKLIEAQEKERRRIAYEVHDGLAQTAVGAHQHLQAFAAYHPEDCLWGREELECGLGLIQHTVREARLLISGLRPTALDDFGLAVALGMWTDQLAANGWDILYKENLGSERLPSTIETALFRIAQEALSNVGKHAGLPPVRVELRRLRGAVRLKVRDWGCGFRQETWHNGPATGEHVGLSSIRERVSLLGGHLNICSKLGEGTLIAAKIPLSQSSEGVWHGAREQIPQP